MKLIIENKGTPDKNLRITVVNERYIEVESDGELVVMEERTPGVSVRLDPAAERITRGPRWPTPADPKEPY